MDEILESDLGKNTNTEIVKYMNICQLIKNIYVWKKLGRPLAISNQVKVMFNYKKNFKIFELYTVQCLSKVSEYGKESRQ